jgi:hypothetical protein
METKEIALMIGAALSWLASAAFLLYGAFKLVTQFIAGLELAP